MNSNENKQPLNAQGQSNTSTTNKRSDDVSPRSASPGSQKSDTSSRNASAPETRNPETRNAAGHTAHQRDDTSRSATGAGTGQGVKMNQSSRINESDTSSTQSKTDRSTSRRDEESDVSRKAPSSAGKDEKVNFSPNKGQKDI